MLHLFARLMFWLGARGLGGWTFKRYWTAASWNRYILVFDIIKKVLSTIQVGCRLAQKPDA